MTDEAYYAFNESCAPIEQNGGKLRGPMPLAHPIGLRWNLFWYVPLFLVSLFFCVGNGINGYRWGARLVENWSWLVVLSPAAYTWTSATLASVFIPIKLIIGIPVIFNSEELACRYRYGCTIGLVALSAVSTLGCWVLCWGSFPLNTDAQGYLHVRMIPFIPLPHYGLF